MALATLQQAVGILQTSKIQPVRRKDWILATKTLLVVTTEVWHRVTMVLVRMAIKRLLARIMAVTTTRPVWFSTTSVQAENCPQLAIVRLSFLQ